MKRITFLLVFLLSMVATSYGQVTYEYGWEPTAVPLGNWTTEQFGFAREVTTPCTGLASARANSYPSNSRSLTSPSLGTSNGGIVTFSFSYKVLNWPGNSEATPANQVQIITEWANSAAGPWFSIGTINSSNHVATTTCTTSTTQFSPTPGSLFIRIKANSVNDGDVYYYIDNVNLAQGAAPTCVSPSNLVASAITSASATIAWNAASPAPSSGYEFYYSNVNAAPALAGTATTGLTSNLTSLTPNTSYYFWVRSKCGTDYSVWSGPVMFRTLCVPFGDFSEDFNSATAGTGLYPSCWNKKIVSTSTAADVSVISNTAASAPNAISMTNSSDLTAGVFLITPSLTAISANTHRMTFKARGAGAGYPIIVGTMSNPADPATFVALQTFNLTTAYLTYNVTLNTSTTANFIAFKHGLGGTFRTLYIDDVIWEPIPTVIPACVGPVTAVINEGCGNFPTTLTWASVPGADGYKISISTTPNGANLIAQPNINSVLTYSFSGNAATDYFYKITPYNAFGDATGCAAPMSFQTYGDGCYCAAVPSSIDNSGITNVQVGNNNYPVTAVAYSNLTSSIPADITRGTSSIMNVTLGTGYGYYTNVWIDFNDNFTFETSELVYTNLVESGNANPTVVNTAFSTPLTAPLGQHRMRIVSTDNTTTPANDPCYSGSYGAVVDLKVNVLPAPACLPPTSSTTANITATTATLNWISTGTKFNVEVGFANEAQGSGLVTSGILANTLNLANLDSQANYAYYIQTDCTVNGGPISLSPWAGPYTFRTACPSFGDFTENFTTETNITAPECWKTLITSTISTPSINVYSYNDYVSLSNSGNVAAALYLVTPSLTALPLNTHRIKFRSYGPAGTSVIVGTMTDPANASTFTAVQTIQLTSAFADYAVAFLNSTTNAYVAFKFVGNATFQTIYIDDVIWETAPTCPDIYVVNFDGSTSTTANISWGPGGAETAWQYAYGASTLTDPAGLTPVGVTTTPSTVIPGLAPSTTYKVWVRAVCGTGFGLWSPAKTFTTACVAVTNFPWTEGFESITPGFNVFPLCWSKENGDYSTAVAGFSNTPRTGTNYLRNSWTATNEFMWTPGFVLTAGVSYDFSFYMQGDGYTGWDVNVFQNTVQNSTGATQLGGTTTASGPGSSVIQPYALISNTIVPTTTGTYYFAIRVNQPSSTPNYIAFDDFRLEPTPTCTAPAAPTAANATVTTATMNWTATTPAPANGYDYFYTSNLASGPNATTTPSGTVAAGITTANLTSLTGSTIYKIYVRSICGANDKSAWSDAGTFTTGCINAVLPYTIDFENATVPNLPLCTYRENLGTGNNWKTELNPGFGFATKVLSYSYNANAANAWFYTNTVTLTAGTSYSISYNYGNNVTATYFEKMKVSYGATANAAAMTTQLADHPNIMQAALQSNTVVFTPATTGPYVFGFNAYSDADMYYLYLDNIVIQEALGTADFDKNSLTAYPNPVKDVLNVSFTQDITDVAVYNLLGQQVLFTKINATKGQVDMSNLASGTYLVKVNSENAVKTIKVIKQ